MTLLLAAALAGAEPVPSPSLPPGFLAVPPTRQATGFSCGAAALLSTLRYWGVYGGTERGLYALLETTPKDGTEPPKLAEGARRFGLQAVLKTGASLADLRKALLSGETVLLDLQAWSDPKEKALPWKDRWEDGHYVVLVALDERNAYVMDPSSSGAYGWLPQSELLERWHDYEDRHGFRQEYDRAAIFLKGRRPAPRGVARPLIRLD